MFFQMLLLIIYFSPMSEKHRHVLSSDAVNHFEFDLSFSLLNVNVFSQSFENIHEVGFPLFLNDFDVKGFVYAFGFCTRLITHFLKRRKRLFCQISKILTFIIKLLHILQNLLIFGFLLLLHVQKHILHKFLRNHYFI